MLTHTSWIRAAGTLLVVPLVSAIACGDDERGLDARDTRVTDTIEDTTATDTTAETTSATDTVEDTTATDTTASETIEDIAEVEGDTASCEYFEEPRVFDCNGLLRQAFYWVPIEREGCPPYYTLGEERYTTAAELAADNQCDAGCEYVATQSVDLIGCVGGTRTGFDVYRAAEGCLESVGQSSAGLFRDICQWHEVACLPMCTPGCREGDVGDPDIKQLSGVSGTIFATPRYHLGQSFVVGRSGILTGVELRLSHCGTDVEVVLTVEDTDGNVLGGAQRPVTAGQGGSCTSGGSLADGSVGDGHFDLTGNCLAVTAGQSLVFFVEPAAGTELGDCDDSTSKCIAGRVGEPCSLSDATCDPSVGLGMDDTNPYAGGSYIEGSTAVVTRDLSFKLLIE